jgi:hypothetical protein
MKTIEYQHYDKCIGEGMPLHSYCNTSSGAIAERARLTVSANMAQIPIARQAPLLG